MAGLRGTRLLLWGEVTLLFGGVLVAMLFGSRSFGALLFGLGAVLLGRVAVAGDRPGRAVGFVLVLCGVFAMVDAAIRLLFGT